jgi:mannosyltransferase OCH1-like enzyme
MEQLSISSFLLNGHQYHLYVYDEMRNIPYGTVVMDANEIIPSSRIFQYRDRATFSPFADFFRYKLLLERGGWWVDTDVVCLKRFDFREDLVFSTEAGEGDDVANCTIIRAPVDSEAMAYAWEFCQSRDPERLGWAETGPNLLQRVVREFGLARFQQSRHVFCPVNYPS